MAQGELLFAVKYILFLNSAAFHQFFVEFFRVFKVVILMFFFCIIKVFEWLHADVGFHAGVVLKGADGFFRNGFLLVAEVIHRKGVAVAAVDKLAALVKRVYPAQKDVKKLFKADKVCIVVNFYGLAVTAFLGFNVLVGWVFQISTRISAGDGGYALGKFKGWGNAPEAAPRKVCSFHFWHSVVSFP